MRHLRLRNKLLISFVVLNFLCTGAAMLAIYSEMRPNFLDAVEYTLIDMSRFMASEIAAGVEHDPQHRIHVENLRHAAENLAHADFPGRRNLYDRVNRWPLRIYVTDATGRVAFDSEGTDEGQDFSGWRDVHLTLKGEYGARSTRADPANPDTSTHFVAAPIQVGGKTVGVISIGKPVQSVAGFIHNSRLKMVEIFIASLLASLIVSAAGTYWIARPVLRLEKYVSSLSSEQPVPFPRLPSDEIGSLGVAFEKIRLELEGKKYVEQYVHNLTHEIKAPLTAILGAAELVEGASASDIERRQLLNNIRSEALRLQDVAEKLLELASLEARDRVLSVEEFDLALLVDEVIESFEVAAQKLNVAIQFTNPPAVPRSVRGERFLIWRALANLVQNALEFAPAGSTVEISLRDSSVHVEDRGPGIPEYALRKVTQRFFSLERPRTGRKSSGLGLSFVDEVMKAHRGRFEISAREGGGTTAMLRW